jgi:septal ring-binding cell division protein DamX
VIRLAALLVSLSIPLALGAADLSAIKAEPNLEKRASRALDNAAVAQKAAEEAYSKKEDAEQANAALDEVSLRETGKSPVKSPRHFKEAEIRTRELLRRLTDLRETMSALDRDQIDKVLAAIQKIHDELLAGIMGGKKK